MLKEAMIFTVEATITEGDQECYKREIYGWAYFIDNGGGSSVFDIKVNIVFI